MKKIKYFIFIFTAILTVTCFLSFLLNNSFYAKDEKVKKNLFLYNYDSDGAKEYLESIYGEGNVSNVFEDNRNMIENTHNYDQSDLNEIYNSNNSTSINNTCTIVACLGIIDYYSSIDEFEYNNFWYQNYETIFEACLNKKFTTINSGTPKDKVDDCVTESFNVFGGNRIGNINWWKIHDNIRDAVNGKTPIILDLPSHSVVVTGLVTYSYDCQKEVEVGWWIWEKKKEIQIVHESKEFVIINEGGSYFNRSIIPLEKITDITNGNQVCWAEQR